MLPKPSIMGPRAGRARRFVVLAILAGCSDGAPGASVEGDGGPFDVPLADAAATDGVVTDGAAGSDAATLDVATPSDAEAALPDPCGVANTRWLTTCAAHVDCLNQPVPVTRFERFISAEYAAKGSTPMPAHGAYFDVQTCRMFAGFQVPAIAAACGLPIHVPYTFRDGETFTVTKAAAPIDPLTGQAGACTCRMPYMCTLTKL